MRKKLNLLHTASFLIYEAFCAFMYCFGSYMLLQKGFSSKAVGIIMAMGNILGFSLQPVISDIADNSRKLSIFAITTIVLSFTLFFSILNCFFINPGLVAAVSFLGFMGATCSVESLFNSFHFVMNENGYDIKFGIARSLGSLSFGFWSSVLGTVFDDVSFRAGLFSGCLISFVLVIVMMMLTKATSSFVKSSDKDENITYRDFLSNHKLYLLIIVSLTCIFYSYTLVDNFLIMVLNEIGGTSTDLGNIMFVKACMEFPTIFLYDKIEARIKTETLLVFASFMMAVKSVFVYIAAAPAIIYAAQILQLFGFALLTPAIISYINKIMNKKEAVRGQALYTMAISIGSTFSSFSSGFLFDSLGVRNAVLFSIIVAAVSAVVFSTLIKKNA